MTGLIAFAALLSLAAPGPQGWTTAVPVLHEGDICVSYLARMDGSFLVVRADVERGWHTFAMDNKVRAEEKLAGREALGMDRPTEIAVSGGLRVSGPWYQSPPKDFSRPEFLSYSWGFDKEALFAARVKLSSTEAAQITIRGQACTEIVCKNVDVTIPLSAANVRPDAEPSGVVLKHLVPVKTSRRPARSAP